MQPRTVAAGHEGRDRCLRVSLPWCRRRRDTEQQAGGTPAGCVRVYFDGAHAFQEQQRISSLRRSSMLLGGFAGVHVTGESEVYY